jgi:hypothetical protein
LTKFFKVLPSILSKYQFHFDQLWANISSILTNVWIIGGGVIPPTLPPIATFLNLGKTPKEKPSCYCSSRFHGKRHALIFQFQWFANMWLLVLQDMETDFKKCRDVLT